MSRLQENVRESSTRRRSHETGAFARTEFQMRRVRPLVLFTNQTAEPRPFAYWGETTRMRCVRQAVSDDVGVERS